MRDTRGQAGREGAPPAASTLGTPDSSISMRGSPLFSKWGPAIFQAELCTASEGWTVHLARCLHGLPQPPSPPPAALGLHWSQNSLPTLYKLHPTCTPSPPSLCSVILPTFLGQPP